MLISISTTHIMISPFYGRNIGFGKNGLLWDKNDGGYGREKGSSSSKGVKISAWFSGDAEAEQVCSI